MGMDELCQKCGGKLTLSSSGSWICLPCFAGLFGGDDGEDFETEATEDRYEIGDILGRGANGTVYRAYDRKLKREVAVKRLNALIPDRQAEARFQLELETIASLEHPHVIPIWDHGDLEGRAFYVMKYVEAGTLLEAREETWEVKRVVGLMLQIVGAVSHGHARGILHRDLKPENILLENGRHAYVTDFGLAKRFTGEGDAGLSLTGELMGTPAYMAPEQARGEQGKVTTATDVFALGGILFWLLTGRRAFEGNESHVILKNVIENEVRFSKEERKRVGHDLATVCLKCLEKEAGSRYATAEELGQELERVQKGEPVVARPISNLARVGRWSKRHPALSGLMLLLGVLALSFVVFVVHSRNELLKEQAVAKEERARAERRLYYANLSLVGQDARNLNMIGLTDRIAEMEEYENAGFELDYWKSRLVRPEKSLVDAPGGAAVLSLSDDGRRYLTGGEGGVVEVFDFEGNSLGRYDHGNRVFHAFFLEDGEVVASFGRGHDAVIWRVSDGKSYPRPDLDFTGIQKVPGKPDSMVGVTEEGGVVFWNWKTGGVWKERKIAGDLRYDHGFFELRGDELIAANAQIWNLETGEYRHLMKDVYWHRGATVSLSKDGKRMMANRKLFEVGSGEMLFNLRNATWEGRNVFLDSGMIASATGAEGVMVWLPEAKEWQHPFWLRRYGEESVASMALSPDGEWLLTGTQEGKMDLWRTADFTEFSLLRLGSEDLAAQREMKGIEFSPDGRQLLTASDLGVADVWDAQSGELLFSQKCHDSDMCGALFLNKGAWIFTAGSDGRASVWDWRAGKQLQDFPKDDSPIWAMAANELTGRVAVAYRTGKVTVWDSKNGEEVAVLQREHENSCGLAISPDGRFLVAGGWGEAGGAAEVWEIDSGKVVAELKGHRAWIGDAIFYDGGSKILTSSADRTVRSWNATTGEELQVFEGHDNTVNAMKISEDGTRLFTVSDDESTRVWDVATGRQLLSIPSGYGSVHDLDLSPDERRVAASSDGVAIVWDIRSQKKKRQSHEKK